MPGVQMPHCAAPWREEGAPAARDSAPSPPGPRPSSPRGPATWPTGDQAGADRLAVEQHGAGAAIAGVAADLGAGQAELVAQHVGQPRGSAPRRTATARPLSAKREPPGGRRFTRGQRSAASARRSSSRPRRGGRRRWPRTSSIGVSGADDRRGSTQAGEASAAGAPPQARPRAPAGAARPAEQAPTASAGRGDAAVASTSSATATMAIEITR